eukprot:954685-Rhodomonas_salina.1
MTGTDTVYGTTTRSPAHYAAEQAEVGISRYAVSSTDIAYSAIGLRARYAMSVTDQIACGAMGLRACCAMSGTDIGHGTTRVDSVPKKRKLPPAHSGSSLRYLSRRVLHDVRY